MTRHKGKICDQHSELLGERHSSNYRCVGCHKERERAKKAFKGPGRYVGRVCPHHPEGEGERYVANKRCVLCNRAKSDTYKHKRAEYYSTSAARFKLEALQAYGGPVCVDCGVTDPDVLTLDHVNEDGAAHRRETGAGCSSTLRRWLRARGYPPGFAVRCFNCNVKKHRLFRLNGS